MSVSLEFELAAIRHSSRTTIEEWQRCSRAFEGARDPCWRKAQELRLAWCCSAGPRIINLPEFEASLRIRRFLWALLQSVPTASSPTLVCLALRWLEERSFWPFWVSHSTDIHCGIENDLDRMIRRTRIKWYREQLTLSNRVVNSVSRRPGLLVL